MRIAAVPRSLIQNAKRVLTKIKPFHLFVILKLLSHLKGEGWEAQTENCVVIEDSRIGAQAAKSAGMKCIVTLSIYTESEPFDDINVDRIFDCVGDSSDERFSLSDLNIKGDFWSKN